MIIASCKVQTTVNIFDIVACYTRSIVSLVSIIVDVVVKISVETKMVSEIYEQHRFRRLALLSATTREGGFREYVTYAYCR